MGDYNTAGMPDLPEEKPAMHIASVLLTRLANVAALVAV